MNYVNIGSILDTEHTFFLKGKNKGSSVCKVTSFCFPKEGRHIKNNLVLLYQIVLSYATGNYKKVVTTNLTEV